MRQSCSPIVAEHCKIITLSDNLREVHVPSVGQDFVVLLVNKCRN